MTLPNPNNGARVRVPPPLVFLSLIGLGAVFQQRIAPTIMHVPFWARVLGALLAAAGLGLVGAARIWFKQTGQNPAPWKPSPVLLVEGIYRYTRNPMYLGVTLFQLGLGLALSNLWIALLAGVGLAIVHFVAVRPEEAYLSAKFGDSYVRYRSAVRRYI